MSTALDVIGDVHGRGHALERLLDRLGYRRIRGVWRHPSRTAIFTGDLIDRGPEQFETVDIVRRMCLDGAAHCVMGNHEYNAIGWVTPDPNRPGRFRRAHSDHNLHQHAAFLRQAQIAPLRYREIIDWFRTLPILLEMGQVRVAHACWDERHAPALKAACRPDGSLGESALVESLTPGTALHAACDIFVKGPRVRLPGGSTYVDHLGERRHEVRIAWWRPTRTVRGCALPLPGTGFAAVPDGPLDPAAVPAISDAHLYFFGHYWLKGRPRVLRGNIACVDYCDGDDRQLTAYRWDGERLLDDSGFVQALDPDASARTMLACRHACESR